MTKINSLATSFNLKLEEGLIDFEAEGNEEIELQNID